MNTNLPLVLLRWSFGAPLGSFIAREKEETSRYRHLLKEEYVLTSGDGVKFVVSNQWEKANVLNLLQIAKNEGWSYEIVRQ